MIPEVTVLELQRELASANPPILIDVREEDELEISRFPAYVHIPLGELVSRLGELDREADLVIVCRSGSRSGRATAYMQQVGFKRVRNLAGGINDWVARVDPTMPVY